MGTTGSSLAHVAFVIVLIGGGSAYATNAPTAHGPSTCIRVLSFLIAGTAGPPVRVVALHNEAI